MGPGPVRGYIRFRGRIVPRRPRPIRTDLADAQRRHVRELLHTSSPIEGGSQ
jgi:hypothetical protein